MKKVNGLAEKLTEMMNDIANFVGRPLVFLGFVALVIVWFGARIFMEYDVWFDIMDMAVFLITFFMLFIVQASQNADTEAMQDKLDEIIDALPKANTRKEGEEKQLKKGKNKR